MLTAAQLKAREGKLTASRVACLMHGDADKIMQLYREMIGEGEPEDLDHIWPVRLGSATEELNLDWFEMKNGTLSRRGDVIVHKKYTWAAATLDGWYDDLGCPVECKHVGGREPLEIIIDRYQPQMQWQMEVTGASQCALSVIMGAAEPVVEFIDRDADYAAEMVKRGLAVHLPASRIAGCRSRSSRSPLRSMPPRSSTWRATTHGPPLPPTG
jgi:predicted phage-related endonuclease